MDHFHIRLYCCLLFCPISAEILSQVTWQAPDELHTFSHYDNVNIYQYSLPVASLNSTWKFYILISDASCKEKSALIYLRYGSYPLIQPDSETMPTDFSLNQTSHAHLKLKSNNFSATVTVMQPLSGMWFAAIVLAPEVDESQEIKQKGLHTQSCKYMVGVNHYVQHLADIEFYHSNEGTIVLNAIKDMTNYYGFYIESLAWQCTLTISNCSTTTTNGRCPITLSARSLGLPLKGSIDTSSVDCAQTEQCSLMVRQPVVDDWLYVSVDYHPPDHSDAKDITFDITVTTQDCSWQTRSVATAGLRNTGASEQLDRSGNSSFADDDTRNIALPVSALRMSASLNSTLPQPSRESFDTVKVPSASCTALPELARYTQIPLFSTIFNRVAGSIPQFNIIPLRNDSIPSLVVFHLQPLIDNGGTLKIDISIVHEFFKLSGEVLAIHGCISHQRIPMDGSDIHCPANDTGFVLTSFASENSFKIYYPYPESGKWHIAFSAKCYTSESLSTPVPCHPTGNITVHFGVTTSSCVDGECNGLYGDCIHTNAGAMLMSLCKCYIGYRGYGCTDDKKAQSSKMILLHILLLTLSNMFFWPSIILGLHRRYFTEAFVYTFAMLSSTFYHACDADQIHSFCLMKFSVHAIVDFFGAVLSFWVTLIMMARLSLAAKMFTYMFGALFVAVAVIWDRFNLWTFMLPCIVAIIVLIISWALKCRLRHKLYPSLKRYLFFIIPGILIALIGLIIFSTLETTDNYPYVHSVWHMCVSLCICFLMPPREKGVGNPV